MAARKKNQTPAEQNGQDVAQTNTTAEQDGQDVAKTGEAGNNGEDKQNGQEQERDEFADIPNPCVYCGPTVRGVARQYTTYQGGIPNELKEFIKEHPAVRRLIIPTSKFAAVRKRMETQGTAEALIYKKVKSELR